MPETQGFLSSSHSERKKNQELSIIQWYVGGTPTARSVVNEQTLPKIDVR
jgi:hypothetical protein